MYTWHGSDSTWGKVGERKASVLRLAIQTSCSLMIQGARSKGRERAICEVQMSYKPCRFLVLYVGVCARLAASARCGTPTANVWARPWFPCVRLTNDSPNEAHRVSAWRPWRLIPDHQWGGVAAPKILSRHDTDVSVFLLFIPFYRINSTRSYDGTARRRRGEGKRERSLPYGNKIPSRRTIFHRRWLLFRPFLHANYGATFPR